MALISVFSRRTTGARGFQIRNRFLTLVVLLMLAGCAPEIGLTLVVPDVPDSVALSDRTNTSNRLRVHVGQFRDNRADTSLVVIDGRRVEPDGSVSLVVQEGFVRYLTDSGVSVAVLGAPSIEGSVTEWRAEVDPSFPSSKASAVAKLSIIVRDSRSHAIYRATFTGESSIEHPLLGEKQVRRLLGQALGSAIEAVVQDEEIMRQLSLGNIN